jgi:hypothetical protein
MVLFRNLGVNHAKGVTGLESLVRRARVRLRAMPQIFLNLQKMALFWIGNSSVSSMKPWMGTSDAYLLKNIYKNTAMNYIFTLIYETYALL